MQGGIKLPLSKHKKSLMRRIVISSMKTDNKKKRYYAVGEKVWLPSIAKEAWIKSLNIDIENKVYTAVVTYKDKGKTVEDKLNLWEINKHVGEEYQKERLKQLTQKPIIFFAKVRETAKIPSKVRENAGYDIYADFEDNELVLLAHETKLVPTGIASSVTEDWSLIGKERGSTGSKGMGLRAGVVDSGYRGEIFIAITNENDKPVVISKHHQENYHTDDVIYYPYTKAIAQLILVSIPDAEVKELLYSELKEIPSSRGQGALGSSGK